MTLGCAIGLSCWGCSLEWIVDDCSILPNCNFNVETDTPCGLRYPVFSNPWFLCPCAARYESTFPNWRIRTDILILYPDTQTSRFMLEGYPSETVELFADLQRQIISGRHARRKNKRMQLWATLAAVFSPHPKPFPNR